MEPLYRNILKKSWEMLKKFKWLWLFGLFAALLGNGGELDILAQYQKLTDAPNFLMNLKENITIFDPNVLMQGLIKSLAKSPFSVIIFIATVLIFLLLIIWLITVSQGALIEAANKIDTNKKINFKNAIKKGQAKFWQIFGLNIITKFILYFILVVLAMPFSVLYLLTNSTIALTTITIFAFIFLIPTAIILSFILKFAFAYVVIKNQKAIDSFIFAWRLFKENWLISIEMAIILFAINLGIGFVTITLLAIISLPFIGLFILMLLIQNIVGANAIITISIIIFLTIILFVGAGLAVFQYSSWTLLFQKLITGKRHPKLIRLINKRKEK